MGWFNHQLDMVYTSYVSGMHTANGVSIMLPIAAYEHLSKNWECKKWKFLPFEVVMAGQPTPP